MKKRIISALLAVSMVTPLLFGCAPSNPTEGPTETLAQSTLAPTEPTTAPPTELPTEPPTDPPTEPPTDPPTEPPTEPEPTITAVQQNSINMLNYLAFVAEEIYTAKDNRVILEDIYTSLMNEINPGTIDEITQDHLRNLRSIIKRFLQIKTKRERLQYLYNQQKAAAMRSAIPDPMAVLSIANARDWKRLVASVAFTVVDSYNNYKSAVQQADQEFLVSGWELDDEEEDTIRRNREYAFDYMVDIVQEYGTTEFTARELGMLTLNEKAVADFAQICATDEVYRKIQFLESSQETYGSFGRYWLELADCYYETGAYQKCLDCVQTYEQLSTGIFRQDFNIVPILPKAIVAAKEVCSEAEYTALAETFAKKIVDNTGLDDWSMRYFAAQVYIELYTLTEQEQYLWTAYELVKNNVSQLIDEQCALNETYLAPVQKLTVQEPDYSYASEEEKKTMKAEYQAEKKRVEAYNKSLAEQRKTELPPLYEPLVLNCDLLFALGEKLHLGFEQQKIIHKMLKTDTCGVFLSRPVNARYSFSSLTQHYDMTYGAEEMVIPANLLTPEAAVSVTVQNSDGTTQIDDYMISQVKRTDSTADTFEAHFTSSQIKKVNWSVGTTVTVTISYGEGYADLTFRFRVSEYVDNFLIPDKVVFEAV